MEKTNLLTLVVTLTVGIILAGSLLMPVISDATTTHKEFTNEGYYEMTYDERDSVTVLWDYENPYQLTVNDEVVPIDQSNFSSSNRRSILMGDDFVLRTNGESAWKGVQFNAATGGTIWAQTSTSTSMEIVFSEGTYSLTAGTSTKTGTYTHLYTVSNDGEFVMKYSNKTAYMLGDSEFIAMGTSTLNGVDVGIKITGSIEEGATISTWKGDGYTFSNIEIHKTEVSGYKDLYQLSSITADVTYDEYTGEITYNYFLVPTKLSAELSNHLDGGEIAILNALPVLIIVALVMMAAGALYLKRDD